MQHINDDIDELYRHAAEDYPLKIEGADWDSVAKRLNDDKDDAALPLMLFPKTQVNSGKKYRYLLLLLLIPAAFITAKYTGLLNGDGNHTNNTETATAKNNTANTPGAPDGQATASPATTVPANGTNAGEKTVSNDLASQPVKHAANGNKRENVTASRLIADSKPVAENTENHVPGLADLHAVIQQQDVQQAVANLHANSTPATPQQPVQPQQPGNSNANQAPLTPAAATTIKESQPPNDDNIVKEKHDDQPVTAATTTAADKPDAAAPGPVTVKKPKRLYVGLYVAPDYTTVKYQPGNKVGFDFGGLVGYKITKSLGVEIGVSVDKKYYTSDGKYYNTSAKWQQQWFESKGKLLNISGYSNLTSFPLILKYDFKPGREGNFFVAGGLISYIVHEENYKYQFEKSNIIYTADKSSKNSTTNMLANLSISAGYESGLGNLCNFRIEPYYRIPVKGIGLGGLPITSMGINIGLTKKIR